MVYSNEREMYPFVRRWLDELLRARYPARTIKVFDSSRKSLARLVAENSLMADLPAEWPSWDIHVDIVGFALKPGATELAFVECKNIPITLGHLSQLLGYSRVAKPRLSFIVSPQGVSDSLKSLLVAFQRTDVLQYSEQKGKLLCSIIVAKWSETASTIDQGSLIAADAHYVGRL